MKSLKHILTALCAVSALFAASVVFGADEKKPAASDSQPTKATIAQLQTNPANYAGKEVTVQARLAGVCTGDGCLTLKDGVDMIEGLPPAGGFKKNPKTGSLLKVTGTVKVKGEGDSKQVAIAVKNVEEVKK